MREALILQGSIKHPKDILYILHVPNRNAVALIRIEVWLDLFDLTKELGLTKVEKKDNSRDYIS